LLVKNADCSLDIFNLEKNLPRQLERSMLSSSDPGSVSSTEDLQKLCKV
jgi:hypothetical protein